MSADMGQEGAEVHAVEKQARARVDPLESLSGQVPQPCVEATKSPRMPLEACALLTRDFNAAMGLPKGELPRCIDKTRGTAYGQYVTVA